MAVPLLALLTVVSLALTWFGPMMDHHFAERHPGHQHLYFGMGTGDHSHAYEGAHSHDASEVLRVLMGVSPVGNAEGIVFLAPGDGTGHGAADLAVPMSEVSLLFGSGDEDGVLGPRPAGAVIPAGASIYPPTRPPAA